MLKRVSLFLLAILLLGLGYQPLIAKTTVPFEASGVIVHESASSLTLTESTFLQVNEWGSTSPTNWEVALHTSGAKKATFFFRLPPGLLDESGVLGAALQLYVTSYGGHPLEVVVANLPEKPSRRIERKGQIIELDVADCLQGDQFVIELIGRAVDNVSTGVGLSTVYGPVKPEIRLTLASWRSPELDHLDIHGATWHYFSHRSKSIPWDFLESYCQQKFGAHVVPTRENLCVEQDGSFRWSIELSASCGRLCTTCPEQTYPPDGCAVTTCSSGWWGDISGCASSE